MTQPFGDPNDTREEILAATYRALQTHGYAELTIDRIDEEFEKSISLIYHHFDNKDDVLISCLEFMLDQYEHGHGEISIDESDAIEEIIESVLNPACSSEEQLLVSSLVELRAQAAHDPEYRAHFERSDQVFRDRFVAIIRAGIGTGAYNPSCDPNAVADTIHTALIGAMVRRATTDSTEWINAVETELQAYLRAQIYT
ncbi:TetR/AcrR family transcriptional regulator [Halalkalirubrum salinum]|uniref:TetR/AcrR family transcriptional regulator n=1 Tax=Halalkalirubrum salinum TaxID=2563889 RepID=UPI0014857AEF|nr:TetR/AcrR family transcriptional regulator [Halalkalirubrum salinum]